MEILDPAGATGAADAAAACVIMLTMTGLLLLAMALTWALEALEKWRHRVRLPRIVRRAEAARHVERPVEPQVPAQRRAA